jgi:hypothetical protein
MTSKERMLMALHGEKPDVLPAAPCYLSLFLEERIRATYIAQYRSLLDGRSRCHVDHAQDTCFRAQALNTAYNIFNTPPDWIEVGPGASHAWAERSEIVQQRGQLYYKDTLTGDRVEMQSIPLPRGDVPLSEMQAVAHDAWDLSSRFSSLEEVERQMPVRDAEAWLLSGELDLPRMVAEEYGDRFFISTILDTPYSDAYDLLGFRGLMAFQHSHPELLEQILQRRLEQTKEQMKAWAATGIHGVFVEEVFSGADAISLQNYDRFVAPYNREYFQHMRVAGLLPIHYVCGDVTSRLERIMDYSIAAVAVEESKKKFHIEISDIVEKVAGACAIFGNIDAVRFGIHATPEEMSAEVERQAGIGAQARGFIISTGSPFPLETNPCFIDTLVSTAHSLDVLTS